MYEVQQEVAAKAATEEAEYLQILLDEGMEPIYFSEEDAKRFQDGCVAAKWEEVKEGLSPEQYQEVRRILLGEE